MPTITISKAENEVAVARRHLKEVRGLHESTTVIERAEQRLRDAETALDQAKSEGE